MLKSLKFLPLAAALALGMPLLASTPAMAEAAAPMAVTGAEGVRSLKSPNSVDSTVQKIKAAVAANGIRFFDDIDQQALATSASIPLQQSRLVLFGNPPLGVQFLTANPYAGLDWPVRMLVFEAADGSTVIAWQDFNHIALRYGLKDRDAQLKMANEVAASIAAAGAAR